MTEDNKSMRVLELFQESLHQFIEPKKDPNLVKEIEGDQPPVTPPHTSMVWMNPGYAFSSDEFDRLENYVTGKTVGLSADEYRASLATYAEISRYFNQVIQLKEKRIIGLEDQKLSFSGTGSYIWDQFLKILEYSEVAQPTNEAEKQEKLKQLMAKLTKVITKKDIITDEEIEETVDSDLVEAYEEYRQEYERAWRTYTNKRTLAQTGDDKSAIADWSANEESYYSDLKAAYKRWVSKGYKNDYERLVSAIDQIASGNLVIFKDDLMNAMRKSKLTDPVSNLPFYPTAFFPLSFHRNTEGWTHFSYEHSEKDENAKSEARFGGGTLGLRLDAFGAPPGSQIDLGAQGGKSTSHHSLNTKGFKIAFDITQVSISRPWFNPDFINMDSWRWKDSGQNFGNVSDGNSDKATGLLPAYPIAAFFIKNVVVKMDEFHSSESAYARHVKAGGGISFGPIRIGGHGGHVLKKSKAHVDESSGEVSVEGTQLIAMQLQLLNKAPNPRPDIQSWV